MQFYLFNEIDINRTLFLDGNISFKVTIKEKKFSNDSVSPPPFETWISKRMKICGNSARFLLLTFYSLFSIIIMHGASYEIIRQFDITVDYA